VKACSGGAAVDATVESSVPAGAVVEGSATGTVVAAPSPPVGSSVLVVDGAAVVVAAVVVAAAAVPMRTMPTWSLGSAGSGGVQAEPASRRSNSSVAAGRVHAVRTIQAT